ncbi:unnamed protein product [Linum tenue]|uniref:Phytocyanin domain-containing protein n=1 Tax=Linum tenue TaxID=586396 RepID=A0AAV0M2F0_9ROSI|nr:unnamed protein product [Linum tenue]
MASSSHSTSLFFFFACTVAASFCFHSSMARSFDVGGKEGWVVKPSESYDHWAQRLRFLVNDTLYKKGSDSVAQVTKGDYDSCDASKKLKVMKSGTSIFKLTQSGHFYFISANKQQCLADQKLNVLVLAVRSPKTPAPPPPPPPSSPAPALPPTASPPPSPAAGSSPPPASPASSPFQGISPAGAPADSGNSPPAGQPAVSPDTADQTSPAAKSSSSSSAEAAVASLALVAVGLRFISLFM